MNNFQKKHSRNFFNIECLIPVIIRHDKGLALEDKELALFY
jgi:hypothetical protein